MKSPVLTVVVPAYNAARTITRTVESLIDSTADIVVFVMDDGSTDNTADVVCKLVARFGEGRLRLFRQENSGAYQARLNALKHVQTKYFGFADADDFVEPTMFAQMLDVAERQSLDVVQSGYYEDRVGVCATQGRVLLESREEVLSDYILPRLLFGREGSFVWDKIYRNAYDFATFDQTDHVTNFEDHILNLHFFETVRRMGFVNKPLYHYVMTDGSAVHSYSDNKIRDFREAVRVRRSRSRCYGIEPDDPRMHAWFRRNRWTAIKIALRANLPVARRLDYVRKLLAVKY